ncbi:MAG: hypothetical protein V1778_02415 [bacterium]
MRLHLQIPADVHCLVALLYRLGIKLGPMKAANLNGGLVDIWFAPCAGASIKRVQARLVLGDNLTTNYSPRRVYLNLRVQKDDNSWRQFTDTDYRDVDLLPPTDYAGWRDEQDDEYIEVEGYFCSCPHGNEIGTYCSLCEAE